MKILLSVLHFANIRNYESVVRALAERGHHVRVIAEEPETFGGQALVERLASEYPTVSWGWAPSPRARWFPFAEKVRFALDYVRFLDPQYAEAEKLRARGIERTPRLVRWAASMGGLAVGGHRVLLRLLKWLDRRLPVSDEVRAFLADQRPDALLLTGLTVSRSTQFQQIKAARALGIRTAACILSWDHLSSKALLHVAPQRTLVWNDTQKREALELHGLPAGDVVVTGAQCYDHWFDRRPVRTRQQFCESMGLDPSRRFILYVCSAMSPVPDPVEPVFVRQWMSALRSSEHPDLREAAVLVRPHPERLREWREVSLDDFDNVVVSGRTPIDGDAKADYFDALFYSDAVVGLCTSAFLEAAIVGRPVLTLLLPAFRTHQEGMAHFRYLLTVGGGLLHTAADLPEHLTQLSGAVGNGGGREERNSRFIEAFIRPGGLATASTPRFVAAVEALVREPAPSPDPQFATPSMATTVVSALATATRSGALAWLMMDAVDSERAATERDRARVKETIVSARESNRHAKMSQTEQALRRKRLERRRKAWSKWRRGLSVRKPIARLKHGMKQMLGVRAQ